MGQIDTFVHFSLAAHSGERAPVLTFQGTGYRGVATSPSSRTQSLVFLHGLHTNLKALPLRAGTLVAGRLCERDDPAFPGGERQSTSAQGGGHWPAPPDLSLLSHSFKTQSPVSPLCHPLPLQFQSSLT